MQNNLHKRILREVKTIKAMIRLYCNDHHKPAAELCPECESLEQYALERLRKCPFQEKKTTCANCPVHCYRSDMRQKVRDIMRYSGPRMTLKHPVLALQHLLDGYKKPEKRNSGV
jgi:hypothetical protein